jgi:hypothetical protein
VTSFTIKQEGGSFADNITLKDITNDKINLVAEYPSIVLFKVNASAAWNLSYTDDWYTIMPVVGVPDRDVEVVLVPTSNSGAPRSGSFTITAGSATKIVTVEQQGKTEAGLILFEDFNWLPASYGNKIIYQTTPAETRYSAWTQAERDRGWSSTPVTDGSTVAAWLYAREGYVKLGKTAVGGDLISPKLTAIEGTKNVKVSFKACGYLSLTGILDAGKELNISVNGPGTVSHQQFILNYHRAQADGGDTYIWQDDPQHVYSFEITGATAETQIRFMAGPNIGVITTLGGNNNNRAGIDDIKVVLKD